MVTAAGYDCIDMRAVSNGEAATNKSTEDARIFTAEPGNTIRPDTEGNAFLCFPYAFL